MLVKPNWDNFKAKFSENPQYNFEWFCYLLFSKEYNQPYGIYRYTNQKAIETFTIKVDNDVIGWQSKFYEGSLSAHKDDIIKTLVGAKEAYPDITKIIFYTNSEFGDGLKKNNYIPKAQSEAENKAEELGIKLVWMFKSNFEIYCQEERNINISRYFFEFDNKWELTSYGFLDTLKEKYLNDFKTISLLTNTSKSIDKIFVNLAIIKEQKEEKDTEKLINREAFLSSYEEIHKPKEPIAIKELINKSNKSLIYGKAGIGKTTLCKYIAYMWAKGELYNEFEYVVYIPLRKWDSTQLKEVIRSQYYTQYKEEINLDIKENSNKILFLFDGYDELKSDKRDGLHDAIRDNNLTHYLITTRPYGYQKSDFSVDEYFETIGFTDEDVTKYTDKFFEKDSEKSKGLKAYLETNISIKHIGYIPLMLEMICSLWEKQEKEFGSDMTMTELYGQVVEDMLKKYSANKDDKRVYTRQNRKKIQEQLGKLAFEGLTKQTILFDGDFIEDFIDDIEFFEENTIYSGFLKSDVKEKDLLDNSFEFPHLTFQEYFSALHVAGLSKEEQSDIIRDWKFYPHMQMFFAFLGGLIGDKEFLLREIEKQPNDLMGLFELFLQINCIREMNKNSVSQDRVDTINKKILSDFFVNTIYLDLNYKILLEALKQFSKFISFQTFKFYVEVYKEDEHSYHTQKDILDALVFIADKNNSFKKELEKIEKNFNIKKNILNNVIQELESINKNNSLIIDALSSLELQENKNLDEELILTFPTPKAPNN